MLVRDGAKCAQMLIVALIDGLRRLFGLVPLWAWICLIVVAGLLAAIRLGKELAYIEKTLNDYD